MFKSLAHYIIESEKLYEFKIKIASMEIDNDMLDRIEHSLGAFEVATISKPKRLPISRRSLDFPAIENSEVTLIMVALRYPCTDDQIRSALSAQGRIPLANIVVIPKYHPEEMRRDDEEEFSRTGKWPDNEIKDPQVLVGTQRLESMLKELDTRKMEFAGDIEKARPTLDSMPQHNVSPIVGRKGKK